MSPLINIFLSLSMKTYMIEKASEKLSIGLNYKNNQIEHKKIKKEVSETSHILEHCGHLKKSKK